MARDGVNHIQDQTEIVTAWDSRNLIHDGTEIDIALRQRKQIHDGTGIVMRWKSGPKVEMKSSCLK